MLAPVIDNPVCDLHVRPIRTHIQNIILPPTYRPVRSDLDTLEQRSIFPRLPHTTPSITGKVYYTLNAVFKFDPNAISLKRLYLSRFIHCA